MQIAYQISADGTDVTGGFQDRLISLYIVDEAGNKSDTAEIVIDDRDHAAALPIEGAKLSISLGVGNLVQMGDYIVDEFAGEIFPATLTIRAKAADMLGDIKARKTRSWRAKTVQDIVSKIASEHGLKPVISDSLKAHFYKFLAQTAESDLGFLTRIAKELDAVTKPAGGSLIFTKRGEGKAADGSQMPVFDVYRTMIADGSWEITGRGKYGRIITEWTDLASATTQICKAGDTDPELRIRHRYASKEEAQKAADAALEKSKRGSGKIRIQLGGFHGDLTAEGKVNLIGIKPELTGEWLITRVIHRLAGTLTTSFEAERDNGKANS